MVFWIWAKYLANRRELGAGGSVPALRSRADRESDPLSLASHTLFAHSRDGAVTAAEKSVEEYFPQLTFNRLVHGILPYRLYRGYSEGLADLKRLMEEEISEGAWVYDEDRRMWYSLGGRTSVMSGRARHEIFPYDISRLSRRPLFIHIHPEQCETFVVPNRDALAMPQFQKKLTKFFASMPSGSDFELLASFMEESSGVVPLRAIIVTSLGITEIRFPSDARQLKAIASTFRDLKDATLLQFGAEGYYARYGIEEEDITFVRKLVRHLNSQLPRGFEIIVHDR